MQHRTHETLEWRRRRHAQHCDELRHSHRYRTEPEPTRLLVAQAADLTSCSLLYAPSPVLVIPQAPPIPARISKATWSRFHLSLDLLPVMPGVAGSSRVGPNTSGHAAATSRRFGFPTGGNDGRPHSTVSSHTPCSGYATWRRPDGSKRRIVGAFEVKNGPSTLSHVVPPSIEW